MSVNVWIVIVCDNQGRFVFSVPFMHLIDARRYVCSEITSIINAKIMEAELDEGSVNEFRKFNSLYTSGEYAKAIPYWADLDLYDTPEYAIVDHIVKYDDEHIMEPLNDSLFDNALNKIIKENTKAKSPDVNVAALLKASDMRNLEYVRNRLRDMINGDPDVDVGALLQTLNNTIGLLGGQKAYLLDYEVILRFFREVKK